MVSTARTVTSPKKFIIGTELLKQLPEHVKDFGDNAFVICDDFILDRVNKEAIPELFKAGLKGCSVKFNVECTEKEINRLGNIAFKNESNVVVGVGGGKTLDSAKAVAHLYGIPVLLYPTIASTDAPCTALAVIYNEKGEFERYLFLSQNPDAVIADVSIIASAPPKFFAAGVGDALATWFEARACYRADGLNLVQKRPSRTGLGIAELCYKLLRENVELAMDAINNKVTTPALEQTIEATIYLSGVGAEAGGLAAAHAINNGMSLIKELHHVQHGEKVVFGLLVQLILEKAPLKEIEEVISIIKTVGLPLTLEDMGLKTFNTNDWRKVAELSCSKEDTMGNMPMKITPDDVYNAIIAANAMAHRYK